MNTPFPRQDDGKGHAWGLAGDVPSKVWERFSPDYEQQAKLIWQTILDIGFQPEFAFAGSEDGEALVARDHKGEFVLMIHLEDPQEARALQTAIQQSKLKQTILAYREL